MVHVHRDHGAKLLRVSRLECREFRFVTSVHHVLISLAANARLLSQV
jgi:hypothetical protein